MVPIVKSNPKYKWDERNSDYGFVEDYDKSERCGFCVLCNQKYSREYCRPVKCQEHYMAAHSTKQSRRYKNNEHVPLEKVKEKVKSYLGRQKITYSIILKRTLASY